MIHPVEQEQLLLKLILPRRDDFIEMIFLAQLFQFWIVKRIPLEPPGKFIFHNRQRVELADHCRLAGDLKLISFLQSRPQSALRGHERQHTNKTSSHNSTYRPDNQSVSTFIPAILASEKTLRPHRMPCSNTRTSAA